MSLTEREHIQTTILEDEMRSSYLDYSMSVIVSRALPDVRDGLKPVHRRILFAMDDLGMQPTKPYKKSARIVGEVLGKYHPHGDSSVYDAMVRMAQVWSLRYPLVQGQGNFGSIDGDSAAAMRYTEARLSWLAVEMIKDLDKNTVDFRPNFDDSLKEPTVLPSAFPTLLVNGASGIAVGMATNIPPHNLREIVGGLRALIQNPDINTQELMEFVKAPDFPTAGIIYGYSGVRDAYETGRGKIIVRAKAMIETAKNGRETIIVTELPYQVSKSGLIEKIVDLVKLKTIEDISDLRDESDRDGMRIVIELKRDAQGQVTLNNLYKHTQMQTTFGVIMLALVNGRPKVFSLKEMLQEFIKHRVVVVVRRTQYDLDAAEKKAHILEGFIIALDNLDEVIKLIRGSKDGATASAALQSRFTLSEAQAKAILDMRLQRLTGLERDKILEDYRETIKLIEKFKAILASSELQMQIIDEELSILVGKYGDERRTEIVYDSRDFKIEDMIADEESIITITHNGLIKRTPAATYRRQKRGGRGVTGAGSPDDDFIEHLFHASTHHHLLFFTDKGRCYKVKVYDLPEGSRQAKGRSIANVINKQGDEKVTAYLPVKEFVDSRFIVMVTRGGTIKKTALSEFENVRQTGIIAINLGDDDKLIGARLTDGESQILLGSRKGLACRFIETDVRPMGRTAQGVRGMTLAPDDYIVGVVIIKRQDTQVLVVSERGMGKRTRFEDFRLTHRGGKGVISMNITEKTGRVCGMLSVLDTEDLITITSQGILIRQHIQEIRTIGRNTQGIHLIRLEEGDTIADITVVAHEDDEDVEIAEVIDIEDIDTPNDLKKENPDDNSDQEILI